MVSSVRVVPVTLCPPFATTTLPDLAVPKVTFTLLASVVVILAGFITLSPSYTWTITFLVLNLWYTFLEVALVKVSTTVASSAMNDPDIRCPAFAITTLPDVELSNFSATF